MNPTMTPEQCERWHKRTCARCGRHGWFAGRWPDGHVCRTCHNRALRIRGTCPGCAEHRALPGIRPDDGTPICASCAGFTQSVACSHCGFEGKLLAGRLCERCTLTDRLTALLDDGSGRIHPRLAPLFARLVSMDHPGSGLAWLHMRPGQPGNAQDLLRRLALGDIELTHEAFHQLQPWRAAAHLEELLMDTGILQPVDKQICSFERWLAGHLATINDGEHAKTIRRFATWDVLSRLRTRSDRVAITPSGRRFAGERPLTDDLAKTSGKAGQRPFGWC